MSLSFIILCNNNDTSYVIRLVPFQKEDNDN